MRVVTFSGSRFRKKKSKNKNKNEKKHVIDDRSNGAVSLFSTGSHFPPLPQLSELQNKEMTGGERERERERKRGKQTKKEEEKERQEDVGREKVTERHTRRHELKEGEKSAKDVYIGITKQKRLNCKRYCAQQRGNELFFFFQISSSPFFFSFNVLPLREAEQIHFGTSRVLFLIIFDQSEVRGRVGDEL